MFDFLEAIELGNQIIEISNSTFTLIVFIALGVGSICSDAFYYTVKFLFRKIKEWRIKKDELQHKH